MPDCFIKKFQSNRKKWSKHEVNLLKLQIWLNHLVDPLTQRKLASNKTLKVICAKNLHMCAWSQTPSDTEKWNEIQTIVLVWGERFLTKVADFPRSCFWWLTREFCWNSLANISSSWSSVLMAYILISCQSTYSKKWW